MPSALAAPNVHVVFSAECNHALTWQSVGIFHSHKAVHQPGPITRLLACSDEQLQTYRGMDIGPTFVHHNYRHNPINDAKIQDRACEEAEERIAKMHGSQCGFCTPGFLVVISALLEDNPTPDDTEIKTAIEGNLCRCTGYQQIVDSVRAASDILASGEAVGDSTAAKSDPDPFERAR